MNRQISNYLRQEQTGTDRNIQGHTRTDRNRQISDDLRQKAGHRTRRLHLGDLLEAELVRGELVGETGGAGGELVGHVPHTRGELGGGGVSFSDGATYKVCNVLYFNSHSASDVPGPSRSRPWGCSWDSCWESSHGPGVSSSLSSSSSSLSLALLSSSSSLSSSFLFSSLLSLLSSSSSSSISSSSQSF